MRPRALLAGRAHDHPARDPRHGALRGDRPRGPRAAAGRAHHLMRDRERAALGLLLGTLFTPEPPGVVTWGPGSEAPCAGAAGCSSEARAVAHGAAAPR